jgi:pantoate--beta-alanine ligase
MKIIRTVAEMTAARDAMSASVGLVPTMGYLHEGHLSLVRQATSENDHVVVTIFVNPTQFGPNEDLDRYPRDEQRDVDLLKREGADIVFIPTADEIYPPGFDDWVEVTGPIAERLEGTHRPGHFRGVTMVCARLFRIIRPTRAYFGQKDAQQLRIIRRMVEQEDIPVEIIAMSIVRESDGLAMSSRNAYLTPEQRTAGLVLSRGLAAGSAAVARGVTDGKAIRSTVRDVLAAEPLLEVDYVSVADEQTLDELDTIDRPALILIAARVGSTRLIDNTIVVPKEMPVPLYLQPLIQPR